MLKNAREATEEIAVPRARKGYVKVEFLAAKETIIQLLTEGHTLLSIHQYLNLNGRVTMSYSVFCRTAKKFSDVERAKSASSMINSSAAKEIENVAVENETNSASLKVNKGSLKTDSLVLFENEKQHGSYRQQKKGEPNIVVPD